MQRILKPTLVLAFSLFANTEIPIENYREKILKVYQHHVKDNGEVHKWNNTNDGLRVFQEWTSILTSARLKPPQFKRKIADSLENYVVHQNMQALGEVGTQLPTLGAPRADFDMSLLWCISMIYLFEEDRELLNDATYLHLIKNVTRLWGQEPKYFFEVLMISFQETENHVFMIESTRYLTNQLLWENKRKLSELDNLRDSLIQSGVEINNRKGPIRNLLLKQMQQILRKGFFEFNAKVYQRFSLHAMNNLYSFARDSAIVRASQSVLDYAAVKFALQSHGAIRAGPYRRNAEKYRETEFFFDDAISSYYAVLTGKFPYGGSELIPFWKQSYSHASCALFAALLKYRVPDVIQEYFNLESGFLWSGMKTRHKFNNKLEASPELYFKGTHFLVTAGGRYKFYKGANFPIKLFSTWKDIPWVYDVTARSSSITLVSSQNTDRSPKSRLIQFKGNPWQKNNLAMYRNFIYGFHNVGPEGGSENQRNWPQTIPRYLWSQEKSCFEQDHFTVCLLNGKKFGIYLCITRLRPKKTFFRYSYQNYIRGTVEVVDTSWVPSFEKFVEMEKSNFKALSGKYEYPLFTGERLFLDPTYRGKRQGIRKIVKSGPEGKKIPSTIYPMSKQEEELSLMEAYYESHLGIPPIQVVDCPGDGRLIIQSLNSANSVKIDFRLWWRPLRFLGTPDP